MLSAEALSIVKARDTGIERYPVKDRESWLVMRQRDVTASAAGALFGVHEYITAFGLYALKAGLISEDAEETAPMRRGRLLEPVALQLLAEERPDWKIERGTAYYRDPVARIGATPDAFARDPARSNFGIVQVKTVEPSIFRKKWKNADGETEVPLWIAIQALIECELTGASWACVAPLVIGFGVEIEPIEIPLHSGLMPELRERVAAFWRNVDAGIAPDPDFGRDAEIIAKLNRDCDGSSIDLSNDNRIRSMLDEDADLASKIKDLTEQRKAIKAETLAKIGPAATAIVDGKVVLTARTIHKKAFEVKASSYRDLRFKRSA